MKKIGLILILIVGIFAFAACDKGEGEQYFLDEYKELTDKDHILKKKTAEEIFTAAKNEEHFIVFFGWPTCPYCKAFVPVINDAAKEMEKEEVWYYDIKEDRAAVNETYLKMLDLVGLNPPPKNSEGEYETDTKSDDLINGYNRIAVPFVAVINYGEVETFDHNKWPAAFEEGENVVDGYTKMGNDILATYMWPVALNEINESADKDIKAQRQEELKQTLKKLFNLSLCGTCEV